MADRDIFENIDGLVSEERDLRDRSVANMGLSTEEKARLRAVEVQLDQCWDLLRRRVVPPAQLLRVPSTLRPERSAEVRSRVLPAAGPVMRNSLVAVRRRFSGCRLTGPSLPVRFSSWTTTTESPCAAQAISTCSRVGLAGS
ncbi:hypothetical protein SGRI78S_05155 [Streptomyces griseus subsp. griseus]